jgi:hypothetical protein
VSRFGRQAHGWWGATLVLALVAGAVDPARAAPPVAPPADRALAECRAARPHEAVRQCLQRAHGARPQAAALCELGRLEEAANQPVEAYEAYRRCLAESASAPAADALKQARARVAHLSTRLALLLVHADQPGATVTVGGQPRGAAARGPIPVEPGSHRLQVDAPGYRPWRDVVTATAGEMMEVRAQLAKEAARAPAPAPRRGGARPAPVVDTAPPGSEGGLEAEVLLERALDAEEARAAADERLAAWCDLAVVDGDNPHRSQARTRCAGAGPGGEYQARLRFALAAEQRGLVGYLALRRKGEGAKLAAIEKFLRTFAALRGSRAHTEAVLAVLAQASDALRRRLCARAGAASLPTVAVSVRAVNERGGLLTGRLFVDGRVFGTVPGSHAVPACADRLGVGLGDGPVTWEQSLPRGARDAEIRAVFRRFVASGDTVRDTATGRTWQRRPVGETQPFAGAQRSCQTLPGGGWRLPTRDELAGLVERRGPPTIDPDVFPGTHAESYWTGSASPDQRYHVYVVNFATGDATGRFVGHEARTRCVK